MKFLNNQSVILIFASFLFLLQSCSNTKAENKQTTANNSPVTKVSMEKEGEAEPEPSVSSAISGELEKAKAEGKAVFVVVTGNGSADTEKALSTAEGAKAIYKNAMVVEMNRDDAANAELVNEWRLTGAPLPLILVVSSKGQLTGGRILAQATAENVAELVPSPKLETVYSAIANNKHAIVVFTKDSFSDKPETLKNCKEAVTMLENQAVLVEVDMDDSKETNFMKQLRINEATTSASVTLVINKQGQVAGTSNTIPDAKKLATAAITPVRGGCGPGCG
ncbi:MAG: hypothetical protein LC658_06825, partial [Bacteroidales bacterium]|nr:hypothetical protein [Bacteroidales bacterium]